MISVMIVDDEEDTLELISVILEMHDMEAISAYDGVEAIEKLRTIEKPPDIFLLDILMPKMDGLEVCKWIKKQERLKDIPVIFFTAKAGSEDREECYKAGGSDFILKPFSNIELLDKIKKYVKK